MKNTYLGYPLVLPPALLANRLAAFIAMGEPEPLGTGLYGASNALTALLLDLGMADRYRLGLPTTLDHVAVTSHHIQVTAGDLTYVYLVQPWVARLLIDLFEQVGAGPVGRLDLLRRIMAAAIFGKDCQPRTLPIAAPELSGWLAMQDADSYDHESPWWIWSRVLGGYVNRMDAGTRGNAGLIGHPTVIVRETGVLEVTTEGAAHGRQLPLPQTIIQQFRLPAWLRDIIRASFTPAPLRAGDISFGCIRLRVSQVAATQDERQVAELGRVGMLEP